jgi:hypothetical protein
MNSWDWKTNDAMKTCSFCGAPNARTSNCPKHLTIFDEDVKYGLYRRNILKDIMIERKQINLKNE